MYVLARPDLGAEFSLFELLALYKKASECRLTRLLIAGVYLCCFARAISVPS